MIEAGRVQVMKRFDQALDVLVRLDVSRVQHELLLQLEPFAHAVDLRRRRHLAEAVVEAVVNDGDLLLGNLEVAQDVALRRLGHRDDLPGAVRRPPQERARVAIRQPIRQVLREHQVDAVVDGDHGLAGRQRRQHVMRAVEQIDPLPGEACRDVDLLHHRIGFGGLHDGPKVRPQPAQRLAVVGSAEQDVLRLCVQPGQLAQQILDVGANPEVMEFPGVDRDPHNISL